MHVSTRLAWFLLVALVATWAASGRAPAQPAPPPPAPGQPPAFDRTPMPDDELYQCKKYPSRVKIKVTLKPETELKDLVTWVMGFTCKSFIYGSGIAGRAARVTIIAPAEMSPEEAYRLFLVALQTMNLTVVPKGKVMEIVESPRAKELPLPVVERAPAADQIVRGIFRPENLSTDDLAALLNSLKSKDGVVTPLPNAGVILVTDYGHQIRSMAQVIREVDVPAGGEKVYIVPIKYADATELAQKLTEIFGMGGGGGGATKSPARPAPRAREGQATTAPSATGAAEITDATPSKILPDTRTNSLIVIASDRAYARILAIIKRLDVPLETGEGQIHVYYLENAGAEELAQTLSALISGQGAAPTRAARGQAGPAQASAQAAAGALGATFEGAIRIAHDKPTNSLVIVASQKDFFALREVIRKLDVPRRQVFVEATILEVSLDKTRRLGLSFHGGKDIEVEGEDALLFGGVQHRELGTIILNPESLFGLAAGVRGAEIPGSQELIGISVPSFGVMFQLLQNNNDVNVLSSPHILTTDNEPAEMTVGQNIPFQGGITGLPGLGTTTGTSGQTGTTSFGFPLQSIQRQDVALKLKITPHVNESDFVRLEIELETSDVASENFGGLGPSWTKRTVKNQITVKDQQPVVLGGLMQDKVLVNQSKVPLLGDIPILGYLFKYERKTKQKTNLLIFLTPYIIKDQLDIQRIFERKIHERREFIEAFTAFEDRNFQPDVDYSRKRGLIEEINQAVRAADEEDRLLRESLERQGLFEEGPVELPPEARPHSAPAEGAPGSEETSPPARPRRDDVPRPAPPGQPPPEERSEE